MITIIFNKPNKSVDISGYGVKSYVDKMGKTIYKVYGVIVEPRTARLVDSAKKESVKTLYLEGSEITIYRNENEQLAEACKSAIDSVVARGMNVFPVDAYKAMEQEALKKKNAPDITQDTELVQDTEPVADDDGNMKPTISVVKKDGGDTNAN